jgi:hypothetical protein
MASRSGWHVLANDLEVDNAAIRRQMERENSGRFKATAAWTTEPTPKAKLGWRRGGGRRDWTS